MDVLAILLACSLHPDDALVRHLAHVQSNDSAYFVGDLATLQTRDDLATAAAALRVAEGIERNGGRPAVGLLGVPLAWAARHGREPIELFDACTNVALATSAFAEYAQHCARVWPGTPGLRTKRLSKRRDGRWSRRQRACILSHFAADLGLPGIPAAVLRSLKPASTVASRATDGNPAQRSQVLGFIGATSTPDDESRGPHLFFDWQPAPSR